LAVLIIIFILHKGKRKKPQMFANPPVGLWV